MGAVMTLSGTPKFSGPHRRCPRFQASVAAGVIALIAVFAVLVLMYLYMPPLR
jgi:hypothetical protein